MTIVSKKTSNINVLEIGTSMTIDTVKKYEEQLKSLIKDNSEIIFKSGTIESIDLAGIQFFIYLTQLAKREKVSIQFNFNLNQASIELVNKTGFSHFFDK